MSKTKKDIAHAALLLRRSGKFSGEASAQPTATEQLQQLKQEARTEETFDEAEICADCQRSRRESADRHALCRDHLAKAMGF